MADVVHLRRIGVDAAFGIAHHRLASFSQPTSSNGSRRSTSRSARRRIGGIIASYTAQQREVLFDYFERAAVAYQESVTDLRG